MTNTQIYMVIFGMALVTYLPRVAPVLFFSKNEMGKELNRFISYFPVAILTALVVKELFFVDGLLNLSLSNVKLIPAIITLVISIKFKSIGATMVLGVLSYVIFTMF